MMRRRTRLRIAWDGPHPRPGEYLHGRHGKLVWLIQSVTTDRHASGTLTLALQRHDGELSGRATIHPAKRAQPTDESGPARVRQLADAGASAVMRTAWRDPEDVRPNASRRPRQITGYRTFCPLRRMAAVNGSRITEAHIIAADQFRAEVDLAIIGRGGRALGDLAPQGFGPSAGPSAAAIEQAYADIAVRRLLKRLAPSHCPMMTHILLLNQSLRNWCDRLAEVRGKPVHADVEMGRLLSVLEILADHYAPAIERALTEGIE